MEELKPSYYAIIPATVRYDSDICPNAKLLYGEITSLCNQKGYCWATNEYFSTLYGLSDRTIRTLIKQLQDKNYIFIELINNNQRKIYIDISREEKNFHPLGKNLPPGEEKNFTHNIKMNNKGEYMNEKILNEILDYDWLNA